MSRSREPFVSGLPDDGRRREPPTPTVAGVSLVELREFCRAQELALRPAAVERFDGAERLPADPDVVREVARFNALVRLLDIVLQRRSLARLIAEELR